MFQQITYFRYAEFFLSCQRWTRLMWMRISIRYYTAHVNIDPLSIGTTKWVFLNHIPTHTNLWGRIKIAICKHRADCPFYLCRHVRVVNCKRRMQFGHTRRWIYWDQISLIKTNSSNYSVFHYANTVVSLYSPKKHYSLQSTCKLPDQKAVHGSWYSKRMYLITSCPCLLPGNCNLQWGENTQTSHNEHMSVLFISMSIMVNIRCQLNIKDIPNVS